MGGLDENESLKMNLNLVKCMRMCIREKDSSGEKNDGGCFLA